MGNVGPFSPKGSLGKAPAESAALGPQKPGCPPSGLYPRRTASQATDSSRGLCPCVTRGPPRASKGGHWAAPCASSGAAPRPQGSALLRPAHTGRSAPPNPPTSGGGTAPPTEPHYSAAAPPIPSASGGGRPAHQGRTTPPPPRPPRPPQVGPLRPPRSSRPAASGRVSSSLLGRRLGCRKF